MLKNISRSLVVIFVSTAFSACTSTGPAGSSNPDLGATPVTHQPGRKAPQSADQAKTPVLAAGMPKLSDDKLQNDIMVSQNSIYFSFGKSEIDNSGMKLLRQNATRLKENPLQTVTLAAFTDNLGSRSLNLAIAEERINIVVSTLRSLGVSRKQIRRKSAGLSRLSSACSTASCRQRMRRVELVYE
ncbi:MAG: OmpA family protein [Deltaproteobacteria bacterium]|nr:OmpA family protein [Deltaproteobacteria bacterium]